MAGHDAKHNKPGASLEQSRTEALAAAPLFPGYLNMVIDGLTDDEEQRFLVALEVVERQLHDPCHPVSPGSAR